MKKALLLAAAAAFALNTMAENTVLYSQDYETSATGAMTDKDGDGKTWRGLYWQIEGNRVTQLSVQNDAEHGNYVQIMQRNKDWNAGGAYCLFKDDATLYADTATDPFSMEKKGIMKYTVEFDAAILATLNAYIKGGNMTWGGPATEFAVLNPNFSTANKWRADYGLTNKEGQNEYYDNVIFLKQSADNVTTAMPEADTYNMEEAVPFSLMNVEPAEQISLPIDGSWNHWKIEVDRATYKVALSINGETKASYTADPELGVSLVLRGLYFRTGSGKSDNMCYVNIDNLKVTAEVPAETGIDKVAVDKPAKAVKFIQDGVLYIATPDGKIVTASGMAVK